MSLIILVACLGVLFGPTTFAAMTDFCPTNPTAGQLLGQLQEIQNAMARYVANPEACTCGECEMPPTPPPVCEGDVYEIDTTFLDMAWFEEYNDQGSSIFLETEADLIACLEEILEELEGTICIDVISITEDDIMGIDVTYQLIVTGPTEGQIMQAIELNRGTATLCSDFNFGAFFSFRRIVNDASWTVLSRADPVYYRVTLPLCVPYDETLADTTSEAFSTEAYRISGIVNDFFDGVPGEQSAEVIEFLPSETQGTDAMLALLVLKSRRFYDLGGIQYTFWQIIDDDLAATCSSREDFTITYYPLPRHRLRIEDGPIPSVGRAEFVQVFGEDVEWGSICSTEWRSTEWPQVFCREKGYADVVGAAPVASVGYPEGQYGPFLQNSRCAMPDVQSIYECDRANGLDVCDHQDDMAVNCEPIVRLVGGPKKDAGRMEFYDGTKWGSVCVNNVEDSNNQQFAEVACRELGYSGVSEVKYVIETSIPVGDADITFMNPDCNIHTTDSMQDCGLRPDKPNCAHGLDVYLNCTGPRDEIPVPLQRPIYSEITCNRNMKVFDDGRHIISKEGDYQTAEYIELQADTQVVAVVCEKTTTGGILASFNNGFKSDRDWMCTVEPQDESPNADWMLPGFDDWSWETPAETHEQGVLPFRPVENFSNPKSKWIWMHWKQAKQQTMYCRMVFNRPSTVELVGGPLPRIGALAPIGEQTIVGDYRFFSENWPSVACREMGYPWAEGVAPLDEVNAVNAAGYATGHRFPDYCPGRDDGYMSECVEFLDTDALTTDVALMCRARLQLVDGASHSEGRLRMYTIHHEWKTACDYEPTTDRYERVCLELGFSGIDSVSLLSTIGNVDLATEDIGLHNALCEEGDNSILDCRDNPEYNPCTHEQDVYIACSGSQISPPEPLAPFDSQAYCGEGSVVELWADGLMIASGAERVSAGVPQDVEVVGVHCTWPDSETSGEMIANFDNGITSDDRWTCGDHPHALWASMHFNPVEFPSAVVVDRSGADGFPVTAEWIQYENPAAVNEIFCRRVVPDYFRVTVAVEDPSLVLPIEEFSAAFQAAAEYYEPLFADIVDDEAGIQTARLLSVSEGTPYDETPETRPDDNHKVLVWALRSVNNDDPLRFQRLLKTHLQNVGTLGDKPVKLEHFTFVRVEHMYLHLRLVDGPFEHVGRAELYKDGIWGSICDNNWWVKDVGHLFCRARDYNGAEGMHTVERVGFPEGEGEHTVINPYDCGGSDSSPYVCIRAPNGEPEDYTHEEDMAIHCIPKLRLSSGDLDREGKLELHNIHGEGWGSVCARDLSDWGFADVACHELGFGDAEVVEYVSKDNLGTNPRVRDGDFIALMNPACNPKTTRTMETCGFKLDVDDCGHDNNVYLRCAPKEDEIHRDLKFPITGLVTCDSKVEVWADGEQYLSNSNWRAASYVEVPWYSEVIALKCTTDGFQGGILAEFDNGLKSDDSWDCTYDEGNTISGSQFSSLDYDTTGWTKSATIGASDAFDVWRGDPEGFLENHPDAKWMYGRGAQGETAIICRQELKRVPTVRIVDGSVPNEGRVELNVDGVWGSVCDNDLIPASWPEIVCKELGFPGLQTATLAPIGNIPAGAGLISMQNPDCDQYTRNTLGQCPQEPSCDHTSDVVVSCQPKIRLILGDEPNEGVVQLFRDGQWGFIADRVKPTPLDDWPQQACRDLGFSGAELAEKANNHVDEVEGEFIAAYTPRCPPDAATMDDCADAEEYKTDAMLSRIQWLECTMGDGGGSSTEFDLVEAQAGCPGSLTIHVDGALVYDSEETGGVALPPFVMPSVYQKVFVQCYPETSGAVIQLAFSEDLPGDWKCVQRDVPPIASHVQFDDSAWPSALQGVGSLPGGYSLAPQVRPVDQPEYPISCAIKHPDVDEPVFDITSPAGCESLDTYLPDMWLQCAYRQCVYGTDPFITLDGQLSVLDERVHCEAGTAVSLSFTSGTDIPCEVLPNVFCGDCPELPRSLPHPHSDCYYLRCFETDIENPQGRFRRIVTEGQCRAGQGVPPNFEHGNGAPCYHERPECDEPPPTTPVPTPPPCTDADVDPTYDETEYLSGCAVLPAEVFMEEYNNALSHEYTMLATQIEEALGAILCDLPADIDIDVADIIANSDGPGIVIEWDMLVTKTPGMDLQDIYLNIQQNVDTGELIHYTPQYVTRYEVSGGGCDIEVSTVHYRMATDLDIEYTPAYDDLTSPQSVELTQGYLGAIEQLYSGVSGNHLTRMIEFRPTTVTYIDTERTVVQVEVDMLTDSNATYEEMRTIFSNAVHSGSIGEYNIAQSVGTEST